ncbi:hypothetical protein [Segetibacter sp.]|jgi:hypothetical protein|nr:hypothetical protein [Segetibacter sp.]
MEPENTSRSELIREQKMEEPVASANKNEQQTFEVLLLVPCSS